MAVRIRHVRHRLWCPTCSGTPIRTGGRVFAGSLLPFVLAGLALPLTPGARCRLPSRGLPAPCGSAIQRKWHNDLLRTRVPVSGSLWLPDCGHPKADIAVTGSFLLGCKLFELDFVVLGEVGEEQEV